MARAQAEGQPRVLSLPAGKGGELAGLALGTLAVLVGASLLSHQPEDPSFLHEVSRAAGTRNWIGPVGAELSALLLGLLGLAATLLPVGLGAMAVRLLRRRDTRPRGVRGAGFVLLLASSPVLLQLLLGEVSWRGATLPAGGALGGFLGDALIARLNPAGAFLVTGAVFLAGASLALQSTFVELLGGAWGWLRVRLAARAVVIARWRQRRDKERLKRRVVAKHLRRREAEAAAQAEEAEAPPTPTVTARARDEGKLDLPLRVVEKSGEGGFAVRRVKGEPPPVDVPAGAAAPAAPPVQSRLFVADGEEKTLPPLNLLSLEAPRQAASEDELIRLGEVIRQSCLQFGVEGTLQGIHPGPVVTVFELKPAPGVKMSQVVNLQDDLALAMKAEAVRIDRIPGRSTLGIEVPNPERAVLRLGGLLAHDKFRRARSGLTMALGTDIHGEPYFADLATMPHLLVAGATGSGKSVGLQSMITSILYKATREEVQFIFIDPKRVELGVYADIPHLKTEVVVEPKKAANALRWAVAEMERRYRLLAELHVRSIDFYNRAITDPEVQKRLSLDEASEVTAADLKPLPYYVVVIDELADLMMVAAADVETSIARLAQMARAVGIHLIVATQRPSVDVITGTIKANFPCRVAYATTSRHDSRTILDTVGAERLLGKGDMLLMPPGTSRLLRLHGAYISEQETAGLIRWLKKTGKPDLDPEILRFNEGAGGSGPGGDGEEADDELYGEAARLVVAERKASASFLQRRMRIGFSRASRLIDLMEQDGLLGPAQGSKPRDVLVPADYFEEIDAALVE